MSVEIKVGINTSLRIAKLIHFLDCNNEIYLTIGLVFIVLFVGGWAWSIRFLIRSKKINKILGVLIKKRERRALKMLDLDKVSQIELEDNKIDEKSFASFFRISTSRIDEIDNTTKCGLSIADPITTIYKYDWTIGEYYSLCTTKHKRDNRLFKGSKVTKLKYNNVINNNQIYELHHSRLNSDNSVATDHAISDYQERQAKFISERNKIENKLKEKRKSNNHIPHSISSDQDVALENYKISKNRASKRSSIVCSSNDAEGKPHILTYIAEIPKFFDKIMPYKQSKKKKVIKKRKKDKRVIVNEAIILDSYHWEHTDTDKK